jgi:alpha-L-fucosidase 2
VSGLCARGGFEIVAMEWKDAKLVKLIIRSVLGGNLRLRVPNALRPARGEILKAATGENRNQFYQVANTPAPVISPLAALTKIDVKKTWLYDLPTSPWKLYPLSPAD